MSSVHDKQPCVADLRCAYACGLLRVSQGRGSDQGER